MTVYQLFLAVDTLYESPCINKHATALLPCTVAFGQVFLQEIINIAAQWGGCFAFWRHKQWGRINPEK